MVSAECLPFAKIGGLADVVPALAAALRGCGHDVRILIPRCRGIAPELSPPRSDPITVRTGQGPMKYALCSDVSGEPDVLLDRADLYDREGLHGPDGSRPWPDNALRFALLSASVFPVCGRMGWIPDVLHLHDWPSAPAARRRGAFRHTASVFTVHNLGYQGIFDSSEASVFSAREGGFENHPMIHNQSAESFSRRIKDRRCGYRGFSHLRRGDRGARIFQRTGGSSGRSGGFSYRYS